MAASFFTDKVIIPDDAQFAVAIGSTLALFESIRNFICKNYGDTTTEWKFYGPKSGWVLKILQKKKNLFFVIPCNGYFKVAFTFGEGAFERMMVSDLPDCIKEQWKEATNHTEGRTVQFDVKDQSDYNLLTRHIEIKLRNF
jgi:hypothetical protein